MVPRSRNAMTKQSQGLRVAMHVSGKERTNIWSLSVHAISLLFVYY